jgi:hypothetical protein
MTHSIDAFFGGAPTLSYPKADNGNYGDTRLIGVVRGGRITDDPQQQQMTKMGTGEPEWWDVARTRPKNQVIVTMLCDGSGRPTTPAGQALSPLDERQSTADDGKRRLYIRGKDMTDAIRTAFQAAGAPGLRVGGELYVVWTGQRPSKMKGGDPARTWAALYIPPTVGIPAQSAAEPRGSDPSVTWGNGPAQGQPATTPNYNQPPTAPPVPQAYDASQAPPDPWGASINVASGPIPTPPVQPFGGQPSHPGAPNVNPFA